MVRAEFLRYFEWENNPVTAATSSDKSDGEFDSLGGDSLLLENECKCE